MQLGVRKRRTTLILFIAILLGAFVAISGVQSISKASIAPVTYHSNPVVGSYPFLKGGLGYVASNGHAYSYVILDGAEARVGATFVILPALNANVPSSSNFTVDVTYRGGNASGVTFDYFIASEGMYETATYSGGPPALYFVGLVNSGFSYSGADFFTFLQGPLSNMTLFMYVGPHDMPGPPGYVP